MSFLNSSKLKSLVGMRDLLENSKLNETIQKGARDKRVNTSNDTLRNPNTPVMPKENFMFRSNQINKSIKENDLSTSSNKKTVEEHVQEVFEEYISKTEFQNNYKKIKIDTIKVESIEEFKEYIEDRFRIDCSDWSELELMTFLVQNYFLLEVGKLGVEEQVSYLCQKLVKLEEKNAQLENSNTNFRQNHIIYLFFFNPM
jgi:hypothetical protein